MFSTTLASVMTDVGTVGAVFGGVIGIALAITLGPRLFKMGLRMMKGK